MRNNNQEYQKKIYAGSGCCARQKGEVKIMPNTKFDAKRRYRKDMKRPEKCMQISVLIQMQRSQN